MYYILYTDTPAWYLHNFPRWRSGHYANVLLLRKIVWYLRSIIDRSIVIGLEALLIIAPWRWIYALVSAGKFASILKWWLFILDDNSNYWTNENEFAYKAHIHYSVIDCLWLDKRLTFRKNALFSISIYTSLYTRPLCWFNDSILILLLYLSWFS